jgi:hypothetical protein
MQNNYANLQREVTLFGRMELRLHGWFIFFSFLIAYTHAQGNSFGFERIRFD